jgi:signal transduction histidine kinase/CheY-like chemotaxis protein
LPLSVGPRAFEARIVRIAAEHGPESHRAAALIRDVTEEKEVARKLAEAERLAALGVLAAGMGHEINNPLMIIRENARMVGQELETLGVAVRGGGSAIASMSKKLDDLLVAADRLQAIVADLRLFRRDRGPELSPVDARAVLGRSIEIARGPMQQRARLELALGDMPLVAARATQLGQVFLNLLVNASQAIGDTDPRGQEIRVETSTDARGWAVVAISDTGCGIPEAELGTIFDPFYTTKREGMGLGLAISSRIVNDFGGTITVESSVGRGTTFRVALPPSTGGLPRPFAPKPQPEAMPRLRLLLIDDEPALLRVLALVLGEQHEVVTAGGCNAAMQVLAGDAAFDAILCDLMMPLGDGMAFYERLGQSALQRRVVFMTGGAYTPKARAFLDSIPNPTLEKPFTPEALGAALTELRRHAATSGPMR